MFESATYESFKKESEVFLESDKPNDKCYVILSGRVGIYRGKVHCDIKIGDLAKFKEGGDETKYPSFKDAVYQGESLKTMKKLSYYGDLLAKLTYGRLFGETGLLNDNPRNASIITLEDTDFMVFHKNALDLIKTYYSKDFTEKKQYLHKMVPEMSMINNQLRITQIIEFFKPVNFRHGQLVTTEGEQSNKIFFMQEGELVMIKGIEMPEVIGNRKLQYKMHQVPLTNIQGQAIVGEECLEAENKHKYSIQVKSAEAKMFCFEKSSNFADFQSFPLFSILLRGYRLKEKTRMALVDRLMLKRYEQLCQNRNLPAGLLPQLVKGNIAQETERPAGDETKSPGAKIFKLEKFDEDTNIKYTNIIKRFVGADKKYNPLSTVTNGSHIDEATMEMAGGYPDANIDAKTFRSIPYSPYNRARAVSDADYMSTAKQSLLFSNSQKNPHAEVVPGRGSKIIDLGIEPIRRRPPDNSRTSMKSLATPSLKGDLSTRILKALQNSANNRLITEEGEHSKKGNSVIGLKSTLKRQSALFDMSNQSQVLVTQQDSPKHKSSTYNMPKTTSLPKLAFGGKYNTEGKTRNVASKFELIVSSSKKDVNDGAAGGFSARFQNPPTLVNIQRRLDLPDLVASAGLKRDYIKRPHQKIKLRLTESSIGDPESSPLLKASKLEAEPHKPKEESRLLRLGSFSDQDEPAGNMNCMDSLEQLSPRALGRRPVLKNKLSIVKR